MITILRGLVFLQAKNKFFKNHRNGTTNNRLCNKLNFLQERLSGMLAKFKNNYYKM